MRSDKRPAIVVSDLGSDESSKRTAADVVSRSFSPDPLVKWVIKNDAKPWNSLDPEIQNWQARRLLRAGITVGVGIFYPPPSVGVWRFIPTPSRVLQGVQLCNLAVQDWWTPAPYRDSHEKRFEAMITTHQTIVQKYQNLYSGNLWYIEVVAVDPSAQGLGVGKVLVNWILEQLPEADKAVLECTDPGNTPFYEKYGFKVVENVTIVDETGEKEDLRMPIMLR